MHVTHDQKEDASRVDLVDYLTSKGYEMVRRGNSYKINLHGRKYPGDMSSLSVFDNRRGWKRWSTGEHGGDTISFLEKNMGMSFQEAVMELTAGKTYASSLTPKTQSVKKQKTQKLLNLPRKTEEKYSRLFAYLTKTRMIDACIVNQMCSEKKLYQDIHGNVVFVGADKDQVPRFACVRGTNTDKPFKGDCDGSDKRYAFSMEGINKSKLYIFEAPIDLMSHATMANHYVGKSEAWKMHSRICLAGTSDVALEHYLKLHTDITELHFCLDNDEAGQSAALKHCEKYSEMGYVTVNHCPKQKDMNEDLICYLNGGVPRQIKNTLMKR